jgi:hypothetical protein
VHNQALLWVSDLKNHPGPSPPTNLQLLQRYTLAVMYQKLNEGNSWKKKKKWLVPSTSRTFLGGGYVQFHNVGELRIELAGQQFERDGSLWAS